MADEDDQAGGASTPRWMIQQTVSPRQRGMSEPRTLNRLPTHYSGIAAVFDADFSECDETMQWGCNYNILAENRVTP